MARARNTTDKHDEALKIFILNDKDEQSKNESLKLFVEMYSMRLRSDREFWLFTASSLTNDSRGEVREIIGDLKELKLDLDDDLFIINNAKDGNALEIFEFYEIHPTVPKQLLIYGTWDFMNGTSLSKLQKWNRRRNLQSMPLKVLTLFYEPFITKLDPILGSNGLYKMEGSFAEVFYGLQV